MPPSISIIIPTLNEATALPDCVTDARQGNPHQIIIADGGSSDATIAVAAEHGVHVVCSERGRARQMNAGAASATGEVLLFLHADCRLPQVWPKAIESVLDDPSIGCGAFAHRIVSHRSTLRLISAADNWRARWLHRPYGDQAIFVRRSLFEQIGGYPEAPILEEVRLLQRLRRITRFRLADAVVGTDARRWERHGVLKTTVINWTVLAGAALRLPDWWLARLYYGFAPPAGRPSSAVSPSFAPPQTRE
ncbi:MAG: TIGR04283 family arsenosugar biosynthesis glycosyltransferase [Planctomycetaceae bacterium]|nr:TIGR04283 family arsenosugar biosynthesis glycosyltransferase [Planctomycetaceae bacterium]